MIDSLGSTSLQEIDTSILQSCPCHFCLAQGIKADAFLILSKEHKATRLKNHKRVMCDNGHIFSTNQSLSI
jgi:hypothetical protein